MRCILPEAGLNPANSIHPPGGRWLEIKLSRGMSAVCEISAPAAQVWGCLLPWFSWLCCSLWVVGQQWYDESAEPALHCDAFLAQPARFAGLSQWLDLLVGQGPRLSEQQVGATIFRLRLYTDPPGVGDRRRCALVAYPLAHCACCPRPVSLCRLRQPACWQAQMHHA